MNIIVGTAGHIDHGKSALVEALTGTNPDRLEEEKRRGITIDLGFAFLELEGVRFGFVDVPGHERFVRNMLAGVGGFDLVVLVIAADESIKPQTREHFDICKLLGIPRGLIVLTKADLVEPDALELVRLEAEEFARGSFLENAPIVPVSAKTGAGLGPLKQELLRVAREVPEKDASRHFRLPIDRAFAIKGFGTVVTGTLVSGSVKPEDEVELYPAGRKLRVRGVQSGGKSADHAVAGQRTAVNLAGIEVNEIHRGMVLAPPGRFEATQRMDVRIQMLPSSRPLKQRARAHFHLGTADCLAEVRWFEDAQVPGGSSGFAQLRLSEPVLALPGDRFILRASSPITTVAGGVVLDALAPRHKFSLEGQKVRAFLTILERGTPQEILEALGRADLRGLNLPSVVARTGWLESEAVAVAKELERQGKLKVVSEQPFVFASEQLFSDLARMVKEQLDQFHKANPLVEGMSRENLLKRTSPGVRPEVFRGVLESLSSKREIVLAGEVVKRAGREITLTREEAQAREEIERAFEKAGLTVPAVKEVLLKLPVEPLRAQKILQLLLREQVLVKLTEDLIFHRKAIARLRELLAGYKRQKGERISVPAFKELTGVTRKYAIPLLEYLDRTGTTRRAGDERVIL